MSAQCDRVQGRFYAKVWWRRSFDAQFVGIGKGVSDPFSWQQQRTARVCAKELSKGFACRVCRSAVFIWRRASASVYLSVHGTRFRFKVRN